MKQTKLNGQMLVNQYRKVVAAKMDNATGNVKNITDRFLIGLKGDTFWNRVKTAWDILRGV
jgi:hypothetical protein